MNNVRPGFFVKFYRKQVSTQGALRLPQSNLDDSEASLAYVRWKRGELTPPRIGGCRDSTSG